MRSALGASRRRVVGQLFLEALFISLTAAVLSLVGARPLCQNAFPGRRTWRY